MRRKILALKSDYAEKASLTILSMLAGLLLSKLFDKYLDFFSILLVFTLFFLIIYHRHSQKVDEVAQVLSHCYGRCKGDIQYYDDPSVFYEAGAQYIAEAKREILIFNDYFGQANVVMGYNTTESYFRKLEEVISKGTKDPAFKMSCIVAASSLAKAQLADKYKTHLDNLYKLANDCQEHNQIQPFAHANRRILYLSFTIIDGEVLRIALEGLSPGKDGPSSRVIGGFIIKDNDEIIGYFRSLYYHTLQQSLVFSGVDAINAAIAEQS